MDGPVKCAKVYGKRVLILMRVYKQGDILRTKTTGKFYLAGMSQAGGQRERMPPQILDPSSLRPPRFLALPLTARPPPPRFSDLETCLLNMCH